MNSIFSRVAAFARMLHSALALFVLVSCIATPRSALADPTPRAGPDAVPVLLVAEETTLEAGRSSSRVSLLRDDGAILVLDVARSPRGLEIAAVPPATDVPAFEAMRSGGLALVTDSAGHLLLVAVDAMQGSLGADFGSAGDVGDADDSDDGPSPLRLPSGASIGVVEVAGPHTGALAQLYLLYSSITIDGTDGDRNPVTIKIEYDAANNTLTVTITRGGKETVVTVTDVKVSEDGKTITGKVGDTSVTIKIDPQNGTIKVLVGFLGYTLHAINVSKEDANRLIDWFKGIGAPKPRHATPAL